MGKTRSRRICPHCNETVSHSTFRQHKRRFYDPHRKKWRNNTSDSFDVYDDDDDSVRFPTSPCSLISGETDSEQSSDCHGLRMNEDAEDQFEQKLMDRRYATTFESSSESEDDGSGKNNSMQQNAQFNMDSYSHVAEEVWEEEEETGDEDNEPKNASNQENLSNCKAVITAVSLFLLLWQGCYGVSGVAISVFFKFIKNLLLMLGDLSGSELIKSIGQTFPVSLSTIKGLLGVNGNDFKIYSMCPKCYAIYAKEHCTKSLPDGRVVSKTCSNVLWPRHPQTGRRAPCGETLMKKVRGKSGNIFWYPRKVYVYQSLVTALKKFISNEKFFEKCDQWKKTSERDSTDLRDIHDGKVWKEFETYDGKPFLKDRNNFALLLNVDWFNPYKHTPGSIGAIYCVFANLPRDERYKRENVILLGLMEGEPKHDMNSVLKPAVDELLKLWEGQWFRFKLQSIFVRVALICIACDIPAARKVAGFMAHNATRGCSRCLKEFPVSNFGEKPDFSGFNRDSWPRRDAATHRTRAFDTLKATSSSQRKKLESSYGVRYTELLRLPYYNCIRFVIIDPMHNLLLGTAKYLFNKWTDTGVLKRQDLKNIQDQIDKTVVPPDVGRIPNKMEAGSAGMTADQWKNWTLVYSPYILASILPKDHYECWMLFVSACAIICARTVSSHKLQEADEILLNFCKKVEVLYGKESITPNMHLHCHLAECIQDFGPVYAFWCFSFERYNGILGTYQHNNKAIPVQMMRRFLEEEYLEAISFATYPLFAKHFGGIIDCSRSNNLSGTLQQIYNGNTVVRDQLCHVNPRSVSWIEDAAIQRPLPPFKTKIMDDTDHEDLRNMYSLLLSSNEDIEEIFVPQTYLELTKMEVYGEIYDSKGSPSPRANHITASWFFEDGLVGDTTNFRPARVHFFMKHTIEVKCVGDKPTCHTYLLACISWFKPHEMRHHFSPPLEVWCKSVFEESGPATFLPVGRIWCRFCPVEGEVPIIGNQKEKVLIVNPLQQKWVAE